MRPAPFLAPLLGCHPSQAFESTVQITAVTNVATAENGEVSLVDVEVVFFYSPLWLALPAALLLFIRTG